MIDGQLVKIKVGKYRYPVTITPTTHNRLFLNFSYRPELIELVKSTFDGAKYHGYDEINPKKVWSITNCARNKFQLDYLTGKNPYAIFDKELIEHQSRRQLYKHQLLMVRQGLTRHCGIWAAEPGTGKTLAAIELMEATELRSDECLWVGPKSALAAVQLEFWKWNSQIRPRMVTYDGLKRIVEEWDSGSKPWKLIVFDESQKLKTPSSQRSQAAQHIADAIREDWGGYGYIILMTGTPAPKSPVDWWKQCEVACPGFIKEGNADKFRNRLGLIVQKESMSGGVYPQLITWYDDERRCKKCGKFDHEHDEFSPHPWEQSKNEVAYLYKRMKGLTEVVFKKDVLSELPDKIFRRIDLQPSRAVLDAAELIRLNSARTITALIKLRALSDGFQYVETEDGVIDCPLCMGKGKVSELIAPIYECQLCGGEFINGICLDCNGTIAANDDDNDREQGSLTYGCPNCSGKGKVKRYKRTAVEVPCPKEDALIDLLDEYEDIGRVVTYAGFSASVDRCCRIMEKKKWNYIRFDGRGFRSNLPYKSFVHGLQAFQEKTEDKLAFIGQPSAGGVGITLTASPVIIYYSNDFNGEARAQSMDRIHRPGMDLNLGATIIDLCHLSSDVYILENLEKKINLQTMSLGKFKDSVSFTGVKYGRD